MRGYGEINDAITIKLSLVLVGLETCAMFFLFLFFHVFVWISTEHIIQRRFTISKVYFSISVNGERNISYLRLDIGEIRLLIRLKLKILIATSANPYYELRTFS